MSLSFGAERENMKRIAFLTQLLPAVAVALAASMGFQMSEPILEAVVFPEKPVIEESVPLSLSRTEAVEETEEKDEEPAAVGEDNAYLSQAVTLLEDIPLYQSVDLDTVSGATFSSNGILDAAADALEGLE